MISSPPLHVLPLIELLDYKLLDLLGDLSPVEWHAPTIASKWCVKDIASHLLDGNLRGLSQSRDRYFPSANHFDTTDDLIQYLNAMNHRWTDAAMRLSPQLLIDLLGYTGTAYYHHLVRLDPWAEAIFSVAWAGQTSSPNWFHIAREYTEKFLHQQQIRDAVNKPGIMTPEFFYPYISTLVYGLPHTFRQVDAAGGTVVRLIIESECGGSWYLARDKGTWQLISNPSEPITATATLDPDTAWKLFSKSWRPAMVMDKVKLDGDLGLARQVLEMVSVMA
jgi:hypothetical protein